MPENNMGFKEKADFYLEKIRELAQEPYTIMEVCGTHTVAIAKSAIRELLPSTIRLISGPGCPVCVTDSSDIDRFLYMAALPNVITATFGDMIRVPGSKKSLQMLRGEGADVRVVYSSLEALELARKNPDKEVAFLGVGFETTTPTVAVSIDLAKQEGLKNYSVLPMHKLVPPILRVLAEDPDLHIDAFLDPGHVCAVVGTKPLEFMADVYGKPGVVTGFEPLDVLEGIYMILKQRAENRSDIDIQYKRIVKKREGNLHAQEMVEKVYETADARWRGIGLIPQSGLAIRQEYEEHDAVKKFSLPEFDSPDTPGCKCGDVLKGRIYPTDCPMFGKRCVPLNPVGPCMVSSEGSCAAYYRYVKRGVN